MPELQPIIDNTMQSRYRRDIMRFGGGNIFGALIRAGELVPPWWSRARDKELERFTLNADQLKSSIYKVTTKFQSIKPIVEPRDSSIKLHRAQAEYYQAALIELSDIGGGYGQLLSKYLWDLFTKDNGAFIEVIGDGDKNGPIEGPALGLNSLDSTRCQRTSNAEYPVIYTDTDGSRYRLHYTRVIYISQQPSTQAEMFGVGLCWVSRAINIAQNLVDIAIYKQEKLGSRPLRQMIVGKGIGASSIWDAIFMANEAMDSQELRKYAKTVVLGDETRTDVDIQLVDLASAPDGFDEKTSADLGMYMIALAGGFPPRDLWPATTTGATKADAMFQHIGGASGYEAVLTQLAFQIGGSPDGARHIAGKFLPPYLRLRYDVVDDQQDQMQADVKYRRAERREKDIGDGVIDVRIAREQALSDNDLTRAQFNRLELNDGRLPDGNSVLSLFLSPDDTIQSLLALSVGDVLNIAANVADKDFILENIVDRRLNAIALLSEAGRPQQKETLHQVIKALDELEALYKSLPSSNVGNPGSQTDMIEPEGNQVKERTLHSTQFNVTGDLAKLQARMANKISDEDLSIEDGRESNPHVTVFFGLNRDVTIRDVRSIVSTFTPFDVTFGNVSLFQTNEKFDVVKVEVESNILRELNKALSALPNSNSHTDYNPHLTLAYVLPGEGRKYIYMANELKGKIYHVSSIIFSRADKSVVEIQL